MSSAIYNHRSLQPTGASGQIAAATQHAHGRLEQSFEAIKHEFDTLAADLGLLRNQRDDYDQKVSAQINELNIIRQSLFELETQQSKVRQQYEDELTRLRQELHTLRTENVRMNMAAAAAASAAGQQAPIPPPPSSLGGGGGGGGGPPSAVPSASASGPGGAYGGPGGPPPGGESASAAGGGYYAGAGGPLPPPPGAGGPSVSGQPSLRELKEREQREYQREQEMRQLDREREQRGRERDRDRELRDREREQRDRERERDRDRDLRMGGIGSLDRERSMRDREQRERDLLRGDRDDRTMRDRMPVDERERLPDLRDPKRVKTDVKRGGGGDMYTSPLPTPSITKQLPPPSSYTPAPQSESQNGLALVPSSAQGIIPGSAIPDDADVPPEFRKEGSDYFVLFNPKLPRSLDVSLVHTLMHESVVCCVRFSHDGKYLATGCNRTAQIYDTKTGAKVCVLVDESAGKAGADLYIRSVCFSPDGKYLATGAEDKQIRIWDISKKRICNVFDGHQQEIYSLDFSLDGRLIVSGSGDKTARIWTMNTDGSNSGSGGNNNNSGSSSGGSTAGSSSGSAANGASGNSASTSSSSKVLTINDAEPNNDAGVTSVAISPNGALVAAGSLDTIVRIWDVNTGQLVERLRGHRDSVYSVAFTPDGRGLVSGSLDKTLKYWDVSALANGVKGAAAAASAAAAAAKNGAEGSGKKDGVGSGVAEKSMCTMNFAGHKDYVLSVAVSHDGKWVVSGSKDRGVQFWDSHTAMAHCMLQGHKNSVISIDLSPAGNMLATGSGDWQARIWKYSDTRYDPK